MTWPKSARVGKFSCLFMFHVKSSFSGSSNISYHSFCQTCVTSHFEQKILSFKKSLPETLFRNSGTSGRFDINLEFIIWMRRPRGPVRQCPWNHLNMSKMTWIISQWNIFRKNDIYIEKHLLLLRQDLVSLLLVAGTGQTDFVIDYVPVIFTVKGHYVIDGSYGYLYFRAVWGKPRKKKGFGRFCPKEFIKCHPCLKYDAINKFYFHGNFFINSYTVRTKLNHLHDSWRKSFSSHCHSPTISGGCF